MSLVRVRLSLVRVQRRLDNYRPVAGAVCWIDEFCPGSGPWSQCTGSMTVSLKTAVAIFLIELEDIEPLIWRRVAVRTSMNLKAVHGVIQAAMGWLDCHLWEFKTNERKYSLRISNDLVNEPDHRCSNDQTIRACGRRRERHEVYPTTSGRLAAPDHRREARYAMSHPQRPVLDSSAAEQRCPPEDCGGFPGYYEFLDNIASKQSKKRKAALDWYGGPYDPDDIDEKQIVASLKHLVRRRPSASIRRFPLRQKGYSGAHRFCNPPRILVN